MAFQPINLPNAKNIDSADIVITSEFENCNHMLDDFAAMDAFYERNGYLFFRKVLSATSVARARDEMLAIAADVFGLVAKGDASAKWTKKPLEGWSEDSPLFAGISRRLLESPENQIFLSTIMGETASMVPIVQYRLYPPHGPVTPIHQDGFYSPGIQNYHPVWIPLIPCPREVGGLMVAVGQHKQGYFHNIGKPTPFPISDGLIDKTSWATVNYEPGDVLVVHPCSPHGAMPNTSDVVRVTLDTRVQSARNPSAFSGTVEAVSPTSITIQADNEQIGEITLSVDESTYIRVRDPAVREDFAKFIEYTVPGMKLTIIRNGEHAQTLRKGTSP